MAGRYRDDEPAPGEWKREQLEQLETGIEQLPAGHLSGGNPTYEPMDNRTWFNSPYEEERKFAQEFLGEEAKYEGLSPTEKQMLYEHGAAHIAGQSAGDIERGQDVQRLTPKVYQRYVEEYGEPSDPTALQRAGQRLIAKHGAEAVIERAEQNPSAVADMLLDAEYEDDSAPDDYEHDPGRTQGMVRGTGTGGSTSAGYDRVEDMDPTEEIRAWQEKTGFTR